jgi:hypothetical protein
MGKALIPSPEIFQKIATIKSYNAIFSDLIKVNHFVRNNSLSRIPVTIKDEGIEHDGVNVKTF